MICTVGILCPPTLPDKGGSSFVYVFLSYSSEVADTRVGCTRPSERDAQYDCLSICVRVFVLLRVLFDTVCAIFMCFHNLCELVSFVFCWVFPVFFPPRWFFCTGFFSGGFLGKNPPKLVGLCYAHSFLLRL